MVITYSSTNHHPVIIQPSTVLIQRPPTDHHPATSPPSPVLQGFAAQFSVTKGQTVQFKIKTDSADYRVDIFRVGWWVCPTRTTNNRLYPNHYATISHYLTITRPLPDN